MGATVGTLEPFLRTSGLARYAGRRFVAFDSAIGLRTPAVDRALPQRPSGSFSRNSSRSHLPADLLLAAVPSIAAISSIQLKLLWRDGRRILSMSCQSSFAKPYRWTELTSPIGLNGWASGRNGSTSKPRPRLRPLEQAKRSQDSGSSCQDDVASQGSPLTAPPGANSQNGSSHPFLILVPQGCSLPCLSRFSQSQRIDRVHRLVPRQRRVASPIGTYTPDPTHSPAAR